MGHSAVNRLSVIIPARNEERRIGAVLHEVLRANVWEVIVVDGESTDRTCDLARSSGAWVVSSQPGRGVQMKRGVAIATGDAFLFLHADTLVPAGYEEHVVRILESPGVIAGAFRLRINAPGLGLRAIEKIVDFRSHVLQLPYGDQGIFLTRETLRRVGGFPSLPVMEDFELIRRLRRLGRIVIAPASVLTSARRWERRGLLRTTLLNQTCIAAYYLGVPAAHIAGWRASAGSVGRRTCSSRLQRVCDSSLAIVAA